MPTAHQYEWLCLHLFSNARRLLHANKPYPTHVAYERLELIYALMAFSFLALGTASAHTLNHAAGASQSGVNTPPTVVRILSRNAFSPNALTVKSGTHVQIVNKSLGSLLVFYTGGSIVLAPKASFMIVATQTQIVAICAGARLTITVV